MKQNYLEQTDKRKEQAKKNYELNGEKRRMQIRENYLRPKRSLSKSNDAERKTAVNVSESSSSGSITKKSSPMAKKTNFDFEISVDIENCVNNAKVVGQRTILLPSSVSSKKKYALEITLKFVVIATMDYEVSLKTHLT